MKDSLFVNCLHGIEIQYNTERLFSLTR